MLSFKRHLEEKLKASDDMGDWVKDFQDSDAPQFKGKSQKKRQQMAVAAKLSAERNEEVELDEAKKDHFVYQKGVVKTKEVVHRGTEQSSKDWIEKNAKHFSHKGKDFDIYKGKYPNVKPSDRLDYRYVAEEVELDQETQYEIVESYLLENNIDVNSLTEEELNELIGKVVGGAFKVGAKAAVGAARLAKRAVVNKQGNVRGTQAAKNDAMKAQIDKVKKQRADAVKARKLKSDLEREKAKLDSTKSRMKN